MTTVYDLSLEQLTERLAGWGEPAFRAKQVHRQLWTRAATYDRMPDVPKAVRERLETELPIGIEVLEEREADRGRTRKALLRLGGRHDIEVVLMGYRDRVTACVSTQSGCAMGCGFCATGQMGLRNNLTAGEIAAQVLWARRAAGALPASTPRRLSNVVFMGMGEPLSNERHTFAALGLMTGPIGMGDRHITVSTVGVAPAIRRLGEAYPQVGLAVSLHAADDALRSELVPVNRLWPLAELQDAVDAWRARTHRRPSIEWAMIRSHERRGRAGRTPRADRAPAPRAREPDPAEPDAGVALAPQLAGADRGVRRDPRRRGRDGDRPDTRGREIDAACGQLSLEHAARTGTA